MSRLSRTGSLSLPLGRKGSEELLSPREATAWR